MNAQTLMLQPARKHGQASARPPVLGPSVKTFSAHSAGVLGDLCVQILLPRSSQRQPAESAESGISDFQMVQF